MKLFYKIFVCFVILFGTAFQVVGYLLINFTYESVVEQEKKHAFQEFQYNKYILQSALYLEPSRFEHDRNENSGMEEMFTVPAALYLEDGTCMYSHTDNRPGDSLQPEFLSLKEAGDDGILFRMFREGEKSGIFVFGTVKQGDMTIYLATETDISSVTDTRRNMVTYFQKIYVIAVSISFPVIFLLTKALTASIKRVGKTAKRIAGGNYSERIETGGKDEIGELASDFNQMASQIEEKIVELSEAAKQKEDFAANFAHELKTPLTSVIGYADMLYQRELSREDVKNAAEYILSEGMRLESLSLKLMDMFVLDKQEFRLERISAKALFDSLEQSVRLVCQKYGTELSMELEDRCLEVEYDLFKTMLLNLVDNAVKADSKSVWISGRQNDHVYQIRVRDDGKGIPPGELGRIMEAFYMVDKSRSRKQHGAGLGLALVLRIAKIHRTELEIESDGTNGTTVSITFHLAEGGMDEGDL